jgi:hypothetical protein
MDIKLKPIASNSIERPTSNDFVMLEINGSVDMSNTVLIKAKQLLVNAKADSMVRSFDNALNQGTFLQNNLKVK